MDTIYDQALSDIFATGSMPDGYFGNRINCAFSIIDHPVVAIHTFGFHKIGLTVVDKDEALWLLQNDPKQRHIHLK